MILALMATAKKNPSGSSAGVFVFEVRVKP